jgi:hypothetical protein
MILPAGSSLKAVAPMRRIATALPLALLVWASTAAAYTVRTVDPLTRYKSADLIVVGQVVDADHRVLISGFDFPWATVRVDAVISGRADSQIRVIYGGPSAEASPPCCTAGREYVFFLSRIPQDGFYGSGSANSIEPCESPPPLDTDVVALCRKWSEGLSK